MTKPQSASDVVVSAKPDALLPLGQIQPRGWLKDQAELQANGITGRLEEVWPDVGPDNVWRGGEGGEDWERGPYYLDGLVPLAAVLESPRLLEKARPWIDAMLSSQDDTGFFGPPSNRDWWPRMVALKVLTQWAEATGDERVEPFMQRYFDYQLEHLPGRPLSSWGEVRGADNALSVWWLYDRTGNERLLELIDLLDDQTFKWNEYLGRDLITGRARVFEHRTHGPNVAMGLKKGAVDWLRDHDDRHRTATDLSFDQLERWHGQAHGWFSGDEWLGGREATAGIETCQVVEMMFTCEVLSTVFGDRKYGDQLESLAFNLLPSSCDSRMLSHQYHQQATQLSVSVSQRDWTFSSDDANVFGLEPHFGCCTANVHQGWPKFVASLWVRTVPTESEAEGLRVVAYAPSAIDTELNSVGVHIDVQTAYPFEESIKITVSPDEPTRFPIALRIPEWAESFSLSVGGEHVEVTPEDGYVTVDREWSRATDIDLDFPMVPRVTRRDRQAAVVRLGPLVMSYPLGEQWHPVADAPGLGEWHVSRSTSWNNALTNVEDCANWDIVREEVKSVPFGLTGVKPGQGSPVVVRATGARVDSWKDNGTDPTVPPESPVLDRGPDMGVDLIPYGLARLRITEFPVAASFSDFRENKEGGTSE